MPSTRHVRVRAFAKINLDLKVLNQGPNGFHEIRSVFQTVSLHDTIEISFTPARKTAITLESAADIPNNLVVRAASLLLDACRRTARVEMKLTKRIPMGGGLGGGSTDAAAVLLALATLAGTKADLLPLAAQLGSDVPFFLLGGTAVALSRGTELYPLPDVPARPILIVAPGIHVSTPEAYRSINRAGNGKLTDAQAVQYINSFQSRVWGLGESLSQGGGGKQLENDFESAVFPRYPHLKSILKNLQKSGACPARMTGSGSALFGVFNTQEQLQRAQNALSRLRPAPAVFAGSFLTRARYRASWCRELQEYMDGKSWPPHNRHAANARHE